MMAPWQRKGFWGWDFFVSPKNEKTPSKTNECPLKPSMVGSDVFPIESSSILGGTNSFVFGSVLYNHPGGDECILGVTSKKLQQKKCCL